MNDQQLTSLFAESDLSAQPDLPPDYLPALLTKARRSARQRRLVTVFATVAAVLIALGLTVAIRPHATGSAPADRGAGTPTLPDHIAPYSLLTSDFAVSPPGRAVLLYEYGSGELFNEWQSLALSADGDVYRQLHAADGLGQWLLSPDGTTVILAESRRATSALTLLDLTKGKAREVPLPEATGVVLLAVSADGRKVAYSTAPVPDDLQAGNAIEAQNAQLGTLSVIDLTTGAVTPYADYQPAVAAAFSPDGQRLAIQEGQKTWIITMSGRVEMEVELPRNWGLVRHNAWSPDGTRLATELWRHNSWQTLNGDVAIAYEEESWYGYGVLDFATGRHRQINEKTDTFLGWRDKDHAIVFTPSDLDNGNDSIAAVTLDSGARTVLTRFDTGRGCELGMQTCQTYRLTVATGLLPELTTRSAGVPDRGPWPTWAVLLLGVPLLVIALVVALFARRRRKRGSGGGIEAA